MAEIFASRATSAAAFSRFEDHGRASNKRSDGVSACMKIRWTAFRLGSAAPSSSHRRNPNDGVPFRSLDTARTNGRFLKQLCGHRHNGLRHSVHSLGGSGRAHTREGRLRMGKDDYYLVDADPSYGDGFSFAGGMYSQEPGPYEEWQERGRIIEAYSLQGAKDAVKDPIFGLKMGENSQTGEAGFRWFFVDEGELSAPPVVLLHGVPSQAYSYRKVLPILAEAGYRAIAPDWLGFGFSDKPQPGPSFSYGLSEYQKALGSFLEALELNTFSIVAQGHLAPAAIRWATANPDRVDNLILLNAPVTSQHAKLPGALSTFSTFLLGEVFAQDPIKASDSTLNSCGPYILDEQDAMVYRRPFLTAGMAGFALTAVTRALNKDLKDAISACQKELAQWSVPTTLLWGRKDFWLRFDGVPEFARSTNVRLVELDQVGHHAQEDYGEVVGEAIRNALRRKGP